MGRFSFVIALVLAFAFIAWAQPSSTGAAAAQSATAPAQARQRAAQPGAPPQAQTVPSVKAAEPPQEAPPAAEARHSPERMAGDEAEQEAEPGIEPNLQDAPPVVTEHEIHTSGRVLKYTATAGRLPIRDAAGKITAEMFFVAYTVPGTPVNQRPLTFAYNGGPGSSSIWLHMGALGPRRVVMQPEGWMPASPYHLVDNDDTILEATDLVMVDAIATGFSRAADRKSLRHYLGVKGDVEAFGEFIRMYITRYERWSSPLYLLGESYGTTRSAGLAGYLVGKGIAFNGIYLLSTAIDLGVLEDSHSNDLPFILILPSYAMAAAYHHKLAPELTQDLAKLRSEVENWAWSTYAVALAKGDGITPEERAAVIDQMSRYIGISKDVIDQANLRLNVPKFTHYLLLDQKLRIGRLDDRFTGPDPDGVLDTPAYDPSGAMPRPPFTSTFNNYLRTELNYRTDMPYYVSAQGQDFWRHWDWGNAIQGEPSTAMSLREALAKDPYLKVMVGEGYYDLATPFFAADYSINHLDLPPDLQKNVTVEHYDAGHMVYLRQATHDKFKRDVEGFISSTLPRGD